MTLAFHPCISAPDTPDHFFIGWLCIIGQEGCSQCSGSPTKLSPFFRIPPFKDGVQHTAYKTISSTNTVQDIYFAWLNHIPAFSIQHDSTPKVFVGTNHLT